MNKRKTLFSALALCIMHACSDGPTETTTNQIESKLIDGHPEWIMQGNIYEVNIRQYTPEGTFNAFQTHLPRLKEMGVQTLWFMPINPISIIDRKGALGSYYAVSNYTAINPEYGTLEDWKSLIKKCHDLGFKVIIDWVPNHTGGDHHWLTAHPDFYVRDANTGQAVSQYDWTDTRKLNYKNAELQDSMIACLQYWIKATDIDGYRCDVAGEVPDEFWKKCIPELKKMKNIFMLAEGDKPSLSVDGFDATYAWPEFAMMKKIANAERPAFALDSIIKNTNSSFPSNKLIMYFTSNHDENTWNKADYGTMPGAIHAPFAVLTQTIGNSIPLIYSGQEEPFLDSLSFFYKDTINFNAYSRAPFYKTLLELRKRNDALSGNASFAKLKTDKDELVYAYERKGIKNKILVLLNLSNEAVSFSLNPNVFKGTAKNVFTGISSDFTKSQQYSLPPWGYEVWEQ